MKEVHSKLVDVVLLTHEDGSTMLCRGGEDAVRKFWNLWPIVKAEFTGEKQLLQLWKLNIVNNYIDIFNLKNNKIKILKLDGWGETSYKNLINSINASKKIDG